MYYLMNKDIVIAKFDIKNEGIFETISIVSQTDKVFSWIKDLPRFIINRKAPKHRKNIQQLFAQCNFGTISGYLNITHALSLNDTLWVKKDNEILSWKDVSLYTNSFNNVIAKIAFDGGMYGRNFSTTSPEYTTNGMFAKCWVREDNEIKLIKKGSSDVSNSGLEPYSEYYASQIIEQMGIDHVDYGLTKKNGTLASKCSLFTSEKYGFVPFTAFAENINTLGDLINFYNSIGLLDKLSEMFIIDALIANQDRHYGNFGFLFDNDTGKIKKVAPLFDHNLSLFCYATDKDIQNPLKYIEDYDVGHRLGGSFIEVSKSLMTSQLQKKLINLKGFKFKKHSRYNLCENRLKQLEHFINYQINCLLN